MYLRYIHMCLGGDGNAWTQQDLDNPLWDQRIAWPRLQHSWVLWLNWHPGCNTTGCHTLNQWHSIWACAALWAYTLMENIQGAQRDHLDSHCKAWLGPVTDVRLDSDQSLMWGLTGTSHWCRAWLRPVTDVRLTWTTALMWGPIWTISYVKFGYFGLFVKWTMQVTPCPVCPYLWAAPTCRPWSATVIGLRSYSSAASNWNVFVLGFVFVFFVFFVFLGGWQLGWVDIATVWRLSHVFVYENIHPFSYR